MLTKYVQRPVKYLVIKELFWRAIYDQPDRTSIFSLLVRTTLHSSTFRYHYFLVVALPKKVTKMGKVISTKHVCQNTNPLSVASLYSDKHGKCIVQ